MSVVMEDVECGSKHCARSIPVVQAKYTNTRVVHPQFCRSYQSPVSES